MAIQVKMEAINFDGVSGPIAAQLFTQEQETKKLAVVFPGAGYSYREPLLKFAIQVLLKKNYQVLALDKIYAYDPDWRKLTSEQEARKIVEDDSVKVINQINSHFSKTPDVLFGRSLGTADYYYAQAIENLPKDRIVIDGADHGMEIANDPIQSIEVLKKVTQATFEWLS